MDRSVRAGRCAAAVAALAMFGIGMAEFGSCSPQWPSMCGVGTPLAFLFISLGTGALVLTPFAMLSEVFSFLGHASFLVLVVLFTVHVALVHYLAAMFLYRFLARCAAWLRGHPFRISTAVSLFAALLVFAILVRTAGDASVEDCSQLLHRLDPFYVRSECVRRFAVDENRPALCGLLTGYDRELCYDLALRDAESYAACAPVAATDQSLCRAIVARSIRDCREGDDPDSCFLDQAQEIRLAALNGYCDDLQPSSIQERCRAFHAGKITPEVLCGDIGDSRTREACIRSEGAA